MSVSPSSSSRLRFIESGFLTITHYHVIVKREQEISSCAARYTHGVMIYLFIFSPVTALVCLRGYFVAILYTCALNFILYYIVIDTHTHTSITRVLHVLSVRDSRVLYYKNAVPHIVVLVR